MMTGSAKLRVFLCHASQDKPIVRELYQRLRRESWIEPWLDEEELLPGQDWDLEIEKAVEATGAVIVLLSSRSVSKEGYVQKELRKVLDLALEKPEETIFMIPLRLDECELPRRLRFLHYVDYFPLNNQERAYQRLLQSLNTRFLQSQSGDAAHDARPNMAVGPGGNPPARLRLEPATPPPLRQSQPAAAAERVDTGGAMLLMIYFIMAAVESLSPSSDKIETLLALSAILAGIALLRRRQIPAGAVFKTSLITYLLIYGFGYRLTNDVPAAFYVAGAAAIAACIVLVISARLPGKYVPYSAAAFAAFLLLVAVYELVTNFEYSAFTEILDILILVMSLVTSVFLLRDL